MLEQGYSNLVVNEQLRDNNLSTVQANLLRKVVYGAVENWLYLDYWLTILAPRKSKPDVKMLLMAGLYELHFLSGTYAHVIVNRYVEAAKKHFPYAKDFVHAVLRKAQREPLNLEPLSPLERLSLQYSHPKWLVGKWLKRYGLEESEALLKANLQQRPLALRVNTFKAKTQQVIASLEEEGCECSRDVHLENAVLVRRIGQKSLENLTAFQQGWVTVQDVSSMLVGHIANPSEGQKWLDLCAAPGGKATDLASRLMPSGQVIACDIHAHKLPLITQNLTRLGLTNCEVRHQDAGVCVEDFHQCFDGVLLDAPCSGFGIIGRKPEIKYRKQPEDIGQLVGIQKALLDLAADYVKPSGYLIYSTCTIFKEENEDQIADFLSRRQDYVLEAIQALVPEGVPNLATQGGMLSLRQSNHWSDGFFIAKLKRKETT